MIKSRPIIFSGEIVRAILDGRKTQTRRVIKPVGKDGGFVIVEHENECWPYRSDDGESLFHTVKENGKEYLYETSHRCPFGKIGDYLWVRETCVIVPAGSNYELAHNAIDETGVRRCVQYFSDDDICLDLSEVCGLKKTPSIFMPKWASRITLEITNVRVERLNDISEEDAIAEGIKQRVIDTPNGDYEKDNCVIDEYRYLWESLNGKGSWDENPWVWVLEFRRTDAPRP